MRRCRGPVSGCVGCLAIFGFLVFTSRLIMDMGSMEIEDDSPVESAALSGSELGMASQRNIAEKTEDTIRSSDRYVTPSLAELGHRGTTPKTNDHTLMVTRVSGSGAELLVLILQKLQGFNAFKHIRLPPDDQGQLSTLQQELLVEEVTSIMRQEAIPLSFDGDVRFLNFTRFGRQSPVYISLIRDPLDPKTLERFIKGDSATIYKGSIAYFCGHDSRCSKRNDHWAFERAKNTVAEWYGVIGVLNHMKETLKVLEKSYPYFFKDASIVYEKLKPKRPINATTTLKPVSKNRLKSLLKLEIEFYDWVKERLFNSSSI